MLRAQFDELATIRRQIMRRNAGKTGIGLAPPFVPWIGRALRDGSPGVYFIGVATHGDYASRVNFDRCKSEIKRWITKGDVGTRSPFWNFIDKVSRGVFGCSYSACADHLGYSNIYKVGVFRDRGTLNPYDFAPYERCQRDISIRLLKSELRKLHDSVIVLLVGDRAPVPHVIDPVFGSDSWNKTREKDGVWFKLWTNNNLAIWSYHPAGARRGRFFNAQLEATIRLANEHLGRSR